MPSALRFLSCLVTLSTLAVGGCGRTIASRCQQICECTRCSTVQRSKCQEGYEVVEKNASYMHCGDALSTYLDCFDEQSQCVNNAVVVPACGAESAELYICSAGMITMPGNVCQKLWERYITCCMQLVDATAVAKCTEAINAKDWSSFSEKDCTNAYASFLCYPAE